jgi:basic amino acid/polyamine antiporter, APA family
MESSIEQKQQVKPHLSLWDTVSIIIGIVIGAGIYETAPFIFNNVSGPWMGLGVWVLGGLLSLIGAFCYAELASTYPRLGGDYVYLSRAYGSWAGFMFGWAQLAIIMTGSIGMMAYVFANYASTVWSFGAHSMVLYAVLAVVALSALNIIGVVFGKGAQNFLTSMKVLGLGGITLAGFFWASPEALATREVLVNGGSFGLAMILVLYTYGGWNDAAFVAAEMNDKKRNIPRALILGTAGVGVIYLLVNAAYLLALGFDGARESRAIAADVLQKPLGEFGARAISVLVMISALGAVNGLIYTGARIYSSMGEDFSFFARLSRWHPRRNSPVWSLGAQAVITLLLVVLVGTDAGRGAVNALLEALGFGALAWEGYGGFETLLRCSAPFFWLFFLMTGTSVIVLRFKDRNIERPFVVPFYPVVPLIFCGTCLYMLYSAINYAGSLALIGGVPVLAGLAVFFLTGRR